MLTQTLTQRHIRQRSQIPQIANSPATEGFQDLLRVLFRGEQEFHWQIPQAFWFLSFWNHAYAAESAGSEYGSIWIGSHGDIRGESKIEGAAGEAAGDFRQRTEK